jgi:hypothetical protein
VEQCEAKIAELEQALDELALLPARGGTGKTQLDFVGKAAELQDRIETWQLRREALLNGGVARRKERMC